MFQIRKDAALPLEEIYDAIMDKTKNKPRDPVSTKQEQQFDENFIHELDKTCQEVSNFIISKQGEFQEGDSIVVPGCKLKYRMMKTMAPVELKRIKKEFLNFCKLKPPKTKDDFGNAFLEFVNSSVDRD